MKSYCLSNKDDGNFSKKENGKAVQEIITTIQTVWKIVACHFSAPPKNFSHLKICAQQKRYQ